MTPQKVVAGINDKDKEAFTWVYSNWFFRILNVVKKMTKGSEKADDITQEVFMALWVYEGEKEFEQLREVYQFLYTTAVYKVSDHNKHLLVKEKHEPDVKIYYEYVEIQNKHNADSSDRFNQLMYIAIEKLPRVSKMVFLLFYKDKLRNKEIARRQGMSVKTVEYHKTYAYKFLKLEVEKSGGKYMFTLTLLL